MTDEDPPDIHVLPWTRFVSKGLAPSGYECRIRVKWRGKEWEDAVILRDDDIAMNSSHEALIDLIAALLDCSLASLADVMKYDKAPLGCSIPPPPIFS